MISRKMKVETVKRRRGKKEKRIDKMEKKFLLFLRRKSPIKKRKKSDKKEEKFWQIYMHFLVFQSR